MTDLHCAKIVKYKSTVKKPGPDPAFLVTEEQVAQLWQRPHELDQRF